MPAVRRFLLYFLLLSTVAASLYYYQQQRQLETQQLEALARTLPSDTRLRIPRGTSLGQIAELASASLPVSRSLFIALARRQGVAKQLQAGVYDFKQGQRIADVLTAIATGDTAVEKIVLIEGKTYADWRRQLANNHQLKQLLPEMSEEDIRTELKINHPTLEGLFLADTYFFQPGDSDLSILRRAHAELNKVLRKAWQNRQDGDTLATPYEALILASIVEKETGKADERPLIAAVFLNRLRVGMRLQADPTTIYGLGAAFDGNLTRTHLRQADNLYNTYMHAGLPPSPIAITGAAAIQAVLNPAQSKYYYFVAKGNGSHHFSQTLREHNNAVNRYQRRRK